MPPRARLAPLAVAASNDGPRRAREGCEHARTDTSGVHLAPGTLPGRIAPALDRHSLPRGVLGTATSRCVPSGWTGQRDPRTCQGTKPPDGARRDRSAPRWCRPMDRTPAGDAAAQHPAGERAEMTDRCVEVAARKLEATEHHAGLNL